MAPKAEQGAGRKTSAPKDKKPATKTYLWKGFDRQHRAAHGLVIATDEESARKAVKMQNGSTVQSLRRSRKMGKSVGAKDVTILTRQLSTMMKSGVSLIQSFEIIAKGSTNPRMVKLIYDIKSDVESGLALSEALRRHPKQFNDLYCNLIHAGETAGILESVLARLAMYQEKSMALRSKIKSAMMYPTMVIGASIVITAVIMIFVIPAFKSVFESFGADLPAPTVMVMSLSEFTVQYWWMILGVMAVIGFTLFKLHQASQAFRNGVDRLTVRLPIFGAVIEKAIIARWARTLSTMFAAGVPLVECLTSVSGASGNDIYRKATDQIQLQVSTGTSLTTAVNNANLFPLMVVQFVAIGEESGSLDTMLEKAADFFEREVDDAVASLSSLMEPLIMIVLGGLIGGIVVAMYLPIFKLGAVV